MNILLVVTGLPDKKSPARSVFNLSYAQELIKHGNDVSILYLRAMNPKRPLVRANVIDNIRCIEVCCFMPGAGPLSSIFMNSLFALLLRGKTLKAALKNKVIVHAIGGGAIEASYLISNRFKKPLISQFIGSDVNSLLPKFLKRKDFKKGIERSAYLCFNSQGLKNTFLSQVECNNNNKVLYRGVKLSEYSYSFHQTEHIKILFLGGFPHNGNLKGGHSLLEAIRLLDRKQLPTNVNFVIGGPNSKSFSRFADEITNDRLTIEFVGAVDRKTVKEMLNDSHIVVIPSMAEGLPNVLYEAMATGNMTIATNVGGIPEILNAGVTGELIEPNDSVALAEVILKGISNKSFVESCAKMGREKIEELDYNKFIIGYQDIYSDSIT